MRVAHLIGAFSKLSETFLYDLVLEGAHQGIDTHVITSERVNPDMRPFTQVHEFDINHDLHLPDGTRSRIPRDPDDIPLLRAHLMRLVRRVQPDVLHAHFGELGWQAAPVAAALRLPLIVSFHGYDVTRLPRDPLWRARYAELFTIMAAAVVVSHDMRERLLALGAPPGKVHLIHVGKQAGDYPFQPRRPPLRRWLSIGRLVEKKGFDDCIRAFDAARIPGASLTIIGEGDERSRLESLVRALRCGDRVHLVGALPHDQVIAHLYQADAFILCSRTARSGDTEGIPTVLMEAQLAGLPTITTRHTGIPEAIPPGNRWLLADEGDVPALSTRIVQASSLNADALHQMSTAAHQHIRQHFDLPTTTRQHTRLYAQVSGAA
jgi:glycosyltransferase involved in cell wall biosynthesis